MKTTSDLNEQSASGIRHPAEWNTWYLYIRSRMQDTLNADEKAIMEELWTMTSKMNHLVTRGIIARKKSL